MMKQKLLLLFALLCSMGVWAEDVIYHETFGSGVSSNTEWSNAGKYFTDENTSTYASTTTWKVSRSTTSPCGLAGSSGDSHIYASTSNYSVIFKFGDISEYSDIVFSCNFANNASGKGNRTITIQVSSDGGTTWSSDKIGANTSQNWQAFSYNVSSTESKNLAIKVTNTANNTSRVDDIKLVGTSNSDPRTAVKMTWSEKTATARVGESFVAPNLTVTPTVSPITYSSSNSEVAAINATTGELDIKAAGETSITASFAGNESYRSATASYTLTVNKPFITTKWDLVTADGQTQLEDGCRYIIVAKPNGNLAILNGAQTSFSSITPLSLTESDFSEVEDGSEKTLTIKTEDDPSFTVTEAETGIYNIKGSSGTWLGGSSTGASLTSSKTGWVFQFRNDETVWIRVNATSMSRAILYRNTPTFQHYATNNLSNNGYYGVYLYKEHVDPSYVTITLNPACTDGELVYGTYSSDKAFVVPNDLIVYEIALIDGQICKEAYKTSDVVPANTGVLVAAEEGKAYEAEVADAELAELAESVLAEDNILRPSGAGITAAEMSTADAGCLYYRLTMHNGTDLGFWWGATDGAGFDLAANKAYLVAPASASAKGFTFSDIVTSIDAIGVVEPSVGVAYNLAGQRVNASVKGIMIINGKKVINK